MNIPNLYISEIFDSIQGEGALTGLSTVFVRLQGCRVGCKWCDTKYSWKSGNKYRVKAIDVFSVINDYMREDKNKYICVTGGEPLEQLDAVSWLVVKLIRNGYKNISMETSGVVKYDSVHKKFELPDRKTVIDLDLEGVFFSVSPKLESALGNRYSDEYLFFVCDFWSNVVSVPYRLQYKFVVSCSDDLQTVKKFAQRYGNSFYTCIQVEGSKLENKEFIKECVNFVNEFSYIRLLIQQHKILRLQ